MDEVALDDEANPILGQIVVAKVVTSEPKPAGVLKNGIRRACATNVAAFTLPTKVILSDLGESLFFSPEEDAPGVEMTSPSPQDGRSSRRQDVWLLAALVLLAVVLPLVVSAVAGALEIPRNDDWSYRRIAIDMAKTGRFALDGMSTTIIVGQTLFTQPFLWLSGLQPWAFTVVGVSFAVGGIVSAYALARQLLPTRDAALAAALLALFPGYLAYAS